MEAVKVFNTELSSLYDSKPPVSRAKMASITKTALKAVKFYKHVVQSVEKFILKCRPEYKVSGLYVIDSIVRQSRHQFGADKDVFAQRFAKNIHTTFQHLLQGAPDEKEKIVRVVHLWQKNNVFPQEIIESLLHLDGSSAVGLSTDTAATQLHSHSEPVNSSSGSESLAVSMSLSTSQSAAVAPAPTLLSALKDHKPSQAASDIETSLSSLAAQLGGTVSGVAENLQTDFLSAFVQLLQTQAGLQPPSQLPVNAALLSSSATAVQQGQTVPGQILPGQTMPGHTMPGQSLSGQPLPGQTVPGNAMQGQTVPGHTMLVQSLPGQTIPGQIFPGQILPASETEPAFDKKLLAFDYDESDDEDGGKLAGATQPSHHYEQLTECSMPPPAAHAAIHQQRVMIEGQVVQAPPAMPPMPPPQPVHYQSHPAVFPHDQQKAVCDMVNEYHGMIPEDRHSQPVPFMEPVMLRDHSEVMGLPQQDMYSNGDSDRWPAVNERRSPDASFRSQFTRYNERAMNDGVMWHGQLNNEVYPPMMGQMPSEPPASYDENLAATEEVENYERSRHVDEFSDSSRERRRDRDTDYSRRHRSRDRSPHRRRERDRTDSSRRSRDHHDSRGHSRDRDSRNRRRSRSQSPSRDLERAKRERMRERRAKGLPPFKEEHLIICSKTLWIGRVNKYTTEQELSSELSQFGEIASINLIPPRGCAYVCFVLRRDAARALEKLKGYKLNGNLVRVAWALDVGVKESEFKDLWDVELGATYIPWSKVPDNLEQLADGAFIDDESLPESVRKAMAEASRRQIEAAAAAAAASARSSSVDALPPATVASTESSAAVSAADDSGAGEGETGVSSVPAAAAPLPGPMMPPGMMPPHMIPGMMGMMPVMRPPGMVPAMMPPGVAMPMFRPPLSQDDQSSATESTASSASSMNWPAPPLPGGYPWPAPPPMSMMGMRPPMMFGPPPAGFPPGNFQQPPRLPLSGSQDGAGDQGEQTGAESKPEGNIENSADHDANNAHTGNFPPPMGSGDWRLRAPPPFMLGPRPDIMRGPRPLLGDTPGPPRGLLGPPPRFTMPPTFPHHEQEEEGEEYGEEYDEEYNEEYGDGEGEEENEEEEYNEECDEEFPFDETTEEEFGQGYDTFTRPPRGYHRGFRGRGPRMGRGDSRWHDGAAYNRLPAPCFGHIARFERPGRFDSPQRYNGPPRFGGDRPPRFDGLSRFDGPRSARFNAPRFEGHFDGPPMLRANLMNVQLEGPFRGGPPMGPRFPVPLPAGGVQPLLGQSYPPWYDSEEMEDEEQMQNEDFEGEESFDYSHPLHTDRQVENEGEVHEDSEDVDNKPESETVGSAAESKTEITSSSGETSTADEKPARKSRWSSVPPVSTEQSTEPADSSTQPADSTLSPDTAKSDAV